MLLYFDLVLYIYLLFKVWLAPLPSVKFVSFGFGILKNVI